jgi:uncharacterized membrane protein
MREAETSPHPPKHHPHILRYTLIGFFTVAPLWVTWLVFDFLLGLLADAGTPFLRATARVLRPVAEWPAEALLNPAFQQLLAVAITLIGLYLIGLITSFLLGRQLIAFMEGLLAKLPLVQTIYGATKRFLHTMQQPSPAGQRVVLIAFPSPEMKAVGLITKIFRDTESGRELAAVYVPTAPNPTSGYIEIVPLEDVVQTDWSMEEAMTFVMTGGTNAPDQVRFANPPGAGT